MNKRIPSLTALRVFSVVSRLQSFSKAAQELYITQGAVSRQIRKLEEELNIKLFHRLTRHIELTPAGMQYQQSIQEAFHIIEKSTQRLLNQKTTILQINALPSVSSYILMPNLSHFAQIYPKIDLRLQNSINPVDFHSRTLDVAIRVGALPENKFRGENPTIDLRMVTEWEGVQSETIAKDILVPFYSSQYSKKKLDLTDLAVLKKQTLIHTSSRSGAWPGWFKKFHPLVRHLKTKEYIEYSHFFMSLESAKSGGGIALVPSILLRADNQLQILSDLSVRSAGDYYLLYLKRREHDFEIQAFKDWCKKLFTNYTKPLP